MSLLTDEEIEALANVSRDPSGGVWPHNFAKALQAALLARLASAELPEPAATVERTSSGIGATISEYLDCGTCVYTADQLTAWGNTRFAQGAAAQLAEPIYQYKRGDDSWVDQTKTSYDYNVKYGASQVRIVYTRRKA